MAGKTEPEGQVTSPQVLLRILWTVMISSFLTPFMGSALTLSLPDMGKVYGANPQELSWVVEIFLLISLMTLFPLGKAADRFGKRKVFLWGAWIFTIATLLAPLAPSFAGLILARIFQGVGAAMFFATNTAILSLAYPEEKRGWALGWNVSMVYAGLSLGTVLGGFLNYYLGWKSIFFFTAAAGLVVILLGTLYVPESYGAGGKKTDWRGIWLYAVALPLLFFGLSEINTTSWAVWSFLTGLLLFALLWHLEKKLPIEQAVLPVQILAGNRFFAMSSLTAMLNYGSTFALNFLLSLYTQYELALDSHQAGMLLLVQPLLMMLISPYAGSLSDKYSPARLCAWGMGLIALGVGALAFFLSWRSAWLVLPNIALIGVGFALFSAPNNNAIMSSVERRQYSMAASMLGSVRMMGQNISMSIAALLLAMTWPGLTKSEQLLHNMEIAFVVFAIACAVGVYTSLQRH